MEKRVTCTAQGRKAIGMRSPQNHKGSYCPGGVVLLRTHVGHCLLAVTFLHQDIVLPVHLRDHRPQNTTPLLTPLHTSLGHSLLHSSVTVTLGQSSAQPTDHHPRTQSSSQPKHHRHQRAHTASRGFHAGGRWDPVASMREEDRTQWLPGIIKMEYRGLPKLGKHHLLTVLSLDSGFVLEGRHPQGYTLRLCELRLKSRRAGFLLVPGDWQLGKRWPHLQATVKE